MKEYIVHWCDTRNTCGGSVTVDAEDRNGAEIAARRDLIDLDVSYVIVSVEVKCTVCGKFHDPYWVYADGVCIDCGAKMGRSWNNRWNIKK